MLLPFCILKTNNMCSILNKQRLAKEKERTISEKLWSETIQTKKKNKSNRCWAGVVQMKANKLECRLCICPKIEGNRDVDTPQIDT